METNEEEKEKQQNSKPGLGREEEQVSNTEPGTGSGTKKKSGYRKRIGSIWDNIKGAFRGRAKDIFILKIKLAFFAVVAVLIFFALIAQGDADDTSTATTNHVASAFASSSTTSDNTESATLYENTGSLLLATDAQLEAIKKSYFEEIEDTRPSYYEAFNIVFGGKESDSVANKVEHISKSTNNDEEGDKEETIPIISATVTKENGAALPSDERTIYEHILRTEKYNFNNVIWRSYVKSGNGLTQSSISFTVDRDSKLKYPTKDANAANSDSQDLQFFVNKLRPYLQSWYIPFDLMLGTIDAQDDTNLNANFAYEIITSGYHEIVMDRYKLEQLDRTVNYLVYDSIQTTTTTTRTCSEYKYGSKISLQCVDKVTTKEAIVLKDVRESKVKSQKETDKYSYSWSYVISSAKLFDKVISTKYEFNPYKSYSLTNFNNYINKRGNNWNKTVEEFREEEKKKSAANSVKYEEKDYYEETEPKVQIVDENLYYDYEDSVVSRPKGTELRTIIEETVIKTETTTKKVGKEYTDTYSWSDTIRFKGTNSGIYNVDSVKDVTGDDLSYDETIYYENVYANKELNIIDLLNSDYNIYKNYLETYEEETDEDTSNVGIRKDALDIGYNTLKKDLIALNEEHPSSWLMYGNSLDILDGLNLGAIAQAGGVNEAIVALAESFEGNNIYDMIGVDEHNIFWPDHWCAMFVSYCMREIESQSGIKIPIPTFFTVTTGSYGLWDPYHTEPGFYDVQEWLDRNPNAVRANTDPQNIAPLSSIQPGDIILFTNGDGSGLRTHVGFAGPVELDENGNVIAITTIEGNTMPWGQPYDTCLNSVVAVKRRTGSLMNEIASFVSVSTVLAEAERGNLWKGQSYE